MFDNDIIKALECCINADCDSCPRCSKEWVSGMCSDNEFLSDVLDFIKRQNSSIEDYKDLVCRSFATAWFWHEKYTELLYQIEREQKKCTQKTNKQELH